MSWDDEARTWDQDPAVRTYAAAAFRSLQETLRQRETSLIGARVLDFGCGTGLLTQAMASHARHVVALDVSAAMIEVLDNKRVSNIEAVCGPLDGFTTKAPFDLVTCSSVCAFVPDYPHTVRRLVEVLAPGGVLVQWDWEVDPEADEPMGLTRVAIEAGLQEAGLMNVTVDIGFREPFEGMVMAPLRGVGTKPL